jgi:hypothetical protein
MDWVLLGALGFHKCMSNEGNPLGNYLCPPLDTNSIDIYLWEP